MRIQKNLVNYEKIMKEGHSKDLINDTGEIKNPKPYKNKDKGNYEALCRGESVVEVFETNFF